MEYQSENRICQNCHKDFTIEADDFSFYEKIKVPPPTFCPLCRFQRRAMFRNEITFYKRECEMCHKGVISIFSDRKGFKVFCSKCWWSDEWDPSEFYLDYNPHKNFFSQLKELQQKTIFMDKITSYASLDNSEYVNHTGHAKNCYLIFNAEFCDNVFYSATLDHVRDSMDCLMMNKTELSYGCIGGDGSNVFFSENCPESVNVWYSKDCIGCSDCFGCVNLINKKFYIYNKPYNKEDFKKILSDMNLDKYSSHKKIRQNIYDFWNKFPRKCTYGRMNNNVVGEYVYNSKNSKECYQAATIEDSAYSQFITVPPFKDSYDILEWGNKVERCIDSVTVGDGAYEVKFCSSIWNNVRNVEYSMYGVNLKDCFGCVNLRKKQYCILNKQYSKEEYETLRKYIIEDMNNNPYIDSIGRVWKYGDFFPYDLSPFSYNESFANLYFPLDRKEIEKNIFSFIEPKKPNYNKTINIDDIPDSIKDITDDFIKEVLQCECGKFYKIVSDELTLLRKLNLPIPRNCPDCRYFKRIQRLNPPILYNRKCNKCNNDIKTSYAPDRPEIIYCEKCYQQEVY